MAKGQNMNNGVNVNHGLAEGKKAPNQNDRAPSNEPLTETEKLNNKKTKKRQ